VGRYTGTNRLAVGLCLSELTEVKGKLLHLGEISICL